MDFFNKRESEDCVKQLWSIRLIRLGREITARIKRFKGGGGQKTFSN